MGHKTTDTPPTLPLATDRHPSRGAHLDDLVVTLADYGIDNWQYPINQLRTVGSPYGPRTKVFSTGRRVFHHGQDIACKSGENLYASANGVVEISTYSPTAGHYITLQHADGDEHSIETRYLHLSKRLVRRGTRVRAGQVIGRCGNTGQSTGAHLHFEVIVDGKTKIPFRFQEARDMKESAEPLHYLGEYPTSAMQAPLGEHSRL
jgi:murein DD-endopeptidase MepM/ murein hydrolase activator NlpD